MLITSLIQRIPQGFASRGAPLFGLRAFSLSAPEFATAPADGVKTRTSKKAAPPGKIYKKDLKPPVKFPGTAWTNFITKAVASRQDIKDYRALLKELGQEWSQMSIIEKDKFAPPKEAMEEYLAKRREWKKALPLKQRKMLGGQRRVGVATVTAYSLFVKDNFDKSLSFAENSKATKVKWDATPQSEKDAYIKRARDMREEKQ